MALAARLAPGTPVMSVPMRQLPDRRRALRPGGAAGRGHPRKAETALGLFEKHVDGPELTERLSVVRGERVTPMMFEHELIERARSGRRRVVLPEGTEERILHAAEVLLRRDVCDIVLLGDEDAIRKRAA